VSAIIDAFVAQPSPLGAVPPGLASRVASLDWSRVESDVDAHGCAVIERLLAAAECDHLRNLYAHDALFRSRVVMARHGFGRGEYKYFSYPLPDAIANLRSALYTALVPLANRWHAAMNITTRFPANHGEIIERCHAGGQRRPTPLLLKYGPDDYNCLHQDLYGEHVFPLQVVVLLSEPGRDFAGGELVMTEQRPRMQSRAMVIPLRRGDAAVIAAHQRPVRGTRGVYRVNLKHGVSRVRSGQRYAAGIVFHDAA
jgi:uncharacterized protein